MWLHGMLPYQHGLALPCWPLARSDILALPPDQSQVMAVCRALQVGGQTVGSLESPVTAGSVAAWPFTPNGRAAIYNWSLEPTGNKEGIDCILW